MYVRLGIVGNGTKLATRVAVAAFQKLQVPAVLAAMNAYSLLLAAHVRAVLDPTPTPLISRAWVSVAAKGGSECS